MKVYIESYGCTFNKADAQIIAGVFELRNGNTFSGTAFTAYGLFWWSLVLIWTNPYAEAGIPAAGKTAMGFYLLLWGIFTLFMFIGTFKHNIATRVVFGSLIKGKVLFPARQGWSCVLIMGMVQTVIQYIFYYIGFANTTGVKGSIICGSNSFFSISLL